MNAYALHGATDDALARRWSSSALAIAALHVAVIALIAASWYRPPPPGISLPAIMVDMAPVTSALQPTQLDLAPGPVMQQADASPPEVVTPEQTPPRVKQKGGRPEAKRPTEAAPAPRTSASPRAEREAPAASAVSSG